jgi:hypothetical protein
MANLLSGNSYRITLEDLKQIVPPPATETWKPIPHHEVLQAAIDEATRRGYEIDDVQISVAGKKTIELNGREIEFHDVKMFSVIKLTSKTSTGDMQYAIGVRNSHNKTMAAGVTVGYTVLVCDNGCFSGDYKLTRKHTNGINVVELMREAFDELPRQWEKFQAQLDQLKQRVMSDMEVRSALFEMALRNVLTNTHDAFRIYDLYKGFEDEDNQYHEAFGERTAWSLYQATTELMKTWPQDKQTKFHSEVGAFMSIVLHETNDGTDGSEVEVVLVDTNPDIISDNDLLKDEHEEGVANWSDDDDYKHWRDQDESDDDDWGDPDENDWDECGDPGDPDGWDDEDDEDWDDDDDDDF